MWNDFKNNLIFYLIRHTAIQNHVIYAAIVQREPDIIRTMAKQIEENTDISLINYYRPIFSQLKENEEDE